MICQEFSRDNSDGVGRIEGEFLGAWRISTNRVMSCVSSPSLIRKCMYGVCLDVPESTLIYFLLSEQLESV
jgi:hypothetical protein